MRHALQCKHGGNVIGRHDDVVDEKAILASFALPPNAVRDEPLISSGRTASREEAKARDNAAQRRRAQAPPTADDIPTKQRQDGQERGDLLVHGLWERGTAAISDVKVVDTDAASYRDKDPMKVLELAERGKKRKYLKACLENRRHFTPFVVSADGLLGREANTYLRRIAALLAVKWDRPYSQVCGFVKARMAIAIVRATSRTLRGSRVPFKRLAFKLPQFEDGAGLGLVEYN